jgi:low affinity Fe/Cu permease
MLPLLQLGPLGSPPGLLVGLIVLALVLLVGRLVLRVAWKLVILAAVAVAVLWLLGILGFQFGILSALPFA